MNIIKKILKGGFLHDEPLIDSSLYDKNNEFITPSKITTQVATKKQDDKIIEYTEYSIAPDIFKLYNKEFTKRIPYYNFNIIAEKSGIANIYLEKDGIFYIIRKTPNNLHYVLSKDFILSKVPSMPSNIIDNNVIIPVDNILEHPHYKNIFLCAYYLDDCFKNLNNIFEINNNNIILKKPYDIIEQFTYIYDICKYLFVFIKTDDLIEFNPKKELSENILIGFILSGNIDTLYDIFIQNDIVIKNNISTSDIESINIISNNFNKFIEENSINNVSFNITNDDANQLTKAFIKRNDLDEHEKNLNILLNLFKFFIEYLNLKPLIRDELVNYYNYFDILNKVNIFKEKNSVINYDQIIININKSINRTKTLTFYNLIFLLIRFKLITNKVNKDILYYLIDIYTGSIIETEFTDYNLNIITHASRMNRKNIIDLPQNKKDIYLFLDKYKEYTILKQKSTVYDSLNDPNASKRYTDCGEATMLNLINYLIYDKERNLVNYKLLPDTTFEPIKDFFKTNSTLKNINKLGNRLKFSKILQRLTFKKQIDHTDVKLHIYANIDLDVITNTYTGWNIRPSYISIVRILSKLFNGINNDYYENISNINENSLKDILNKFKIPSLDKSTYKYITSDDAINGVNGITVNIKNISMTLTHVHSYIELFGNTKISSELSITITNQSIEKLFPMSTDDIRCLLVYYKNTNGEPILTEELLLYHKSINYFIDFIIDPQLKSIQTDDLNKLFVDKFNETFGMKFNDSQLYIFYQKTLDYYIRITKLDPRKDFFDDKYKYLIDGSKPFIFTKYLDMLFQKLLYKHYINILSVHNIAYYIPIFLSIYIEEDPINIINFNNKIKTISNNDDEYNDTINFKLKFSIQFSKDADNEYKVLLSEKYSESVKKILSNFTQCFDLIFEKNTTDVNILAKFNLKFNSSLDEDALRKFYNMIFNYTNLLIYFIMHNNIRLTRRDTNNNFYTDLYFKKLDNINRNNLKKDDSLYYFNKYMKYKNKYIRLKHVMF
jgi:hypothetical protein